MNMGTVAGEAPGGEGEGVILAHQFLLCIVPSRCYCGSRGRGRGVRGGR